MALLPSFFERVLIPRPPPSSDTAPFVSAVDAEADSCSLRAFSLAFLFARSIILALCFLLASSASESEPPSDPDIVVASVVPLSIPPRSGVRFDRFDRPLSSPSDLEDLERVSV